MFKDVYLHLSDEHDDVDPEVIAPILYEIFAPESVSDLGCGIGNFLYKFKECGVKKVLGIDGAWSNNKLQKLKGDDLLLKNLMEDLQVKERFDLAISFEFAEHLYEQYAEKIVGDLTGMSDVVVFSAAIPGQGGQNHLNEQWPDFWVKLFNAKGYDCYDVIRPLIWNIPEVKFWYKQNMFVAVNTRNATETERLLNRFPEAKQSKNVIRPLVHPDLLETKITRINRLVRMLKGKASLSEYKLEIAKVFQKKYRS